MATKKKVVKVRDLKPSKDAKGGSARQQASTRQNATGRQQNAAQRGFTHQ